MPEGNMVSGKTRKIITITLLAVFFVGLSVLLYPSISSYWNSKTQSKAVTDYDSLVKALTPKDYSEFFEKADAYNAALASLPFALADHSGVDGYHECLNATGNGMMGYIDIDKIQVKLPIYHGTDASTLSIAAGHIEGSSLPVGGAGTHSVISAHRGLPSAKLFTDLDKLEIGDTFRITVLDRTMVYEVDLIKTVLPSDVGDLAIDEDSDLFTLVTCTPYGINTHRLLVRGHRIESQETRVMHVVSEAYIVDRLIVTPIVALPILLALMLYVFFKPAKKRLPINDDGEIS